jgi:phosphate transport system substrate-binding protein
MFKKVSLLVAMLMLAMFVVACSSPTPAPTSAPVVQTVVQVQTKVVEATKVVEKVITPTPGPQPTAAPKAGSVTVNGAGASFPFPLYSRWFYDYAFVDPSAKINYQSIGSGGGINAITQKTVDFGASDAILTDAQYTAAKGIQMMPTVAGAIVPVYNLKDTDGKVITATLNFSYEALANIYLGTIKKWDDPVLTKANPNVKLPSKDIAIVRRSDSSGTTFAYTDYLSQVSAEWKTKVGSASSVKWPVEGIGGKGNEGVAAMVGLNDGTIGYVEFAYAKQNNLVYGAVQNKAGEFVKPSVEAVQAAMADYGTNMGDKLALSIANPPGKTSWPIATYTYLLVYMDQTDCVKGKKVVDFVKWALTDPAAEATAKSLDYVPLPDAVKKQVLDKASKVTCQGKAF